MLLPTIGALLRLAGYYLVMIEEKAPDSKLVLSLNLSGSLILLNWAITGGNEGIAVLNTAWLIITLIKFCKN